MAGAAGAAGAMENIEIILRGIIAFQALYRGHRTRRAMKKVREEFALIFTDIEGDNSSLFDVQWHSNFVIGRPCIKSSKRCDNSTTREEPCKLEVEEIGKDFPDSSSKPISGEGDVEMDSPDKKECENQPTLSDALNNAREQVEESDNDKQPTLSNSKDKFDEELITRGESLSSSTVQPGLQKPSSCNDMTEPKDSLEEALGYTEFTKGDKHFLHYLKLDNIRSMTKEMLSQKEREIQMELIWIQQAIESRKQYIKLKG